MASAGGREVGRVSIRVVPNTDGFRRKTEEGLRHLRDMKMHIDPEFDREQVKRKAKQAAEDAKQKIPFEPDLDKSSLSAQARLASIWASRFKVRFRAVLDGKLATLQAKALADKLQKIANGTYLKFDRNALSFRSLMDVSGMTDGLDKAISRMRVFMHHYDEMKRFTKHATLAAAFNGSEKFSARMFRLKGTMRALKEAMADSTRAVVDSIKPWQSYKQSIKGFISLGNALGGIMSGFVGVLGISSAVIIGASYVIGGIVDAVKTLSGSLLMLPGAAMMAGGAFTAVRLAFSGFGDAAKAALDPTADLESAVEDLTPAAAESAKAIRTMAQPLKDMQERIQETTFEGWAPQIEAIGRKYIPHLSTGLNLVAKSTNKIGNEFFRWAMQGRTLNAMNRGLALTSLSMRNLANATKPALTGFTELGVAGMEAIRNLTAGLPKLAKRFESWATSDKGQREMREWIDGGIKGFQDLWSAGRKLSGALTEIGHAFGVTFNGDAIARFDETMGKFQSWIGSADDANSNIAKFAQSAKNFAEPWIDAFQRIIDAMRPAFDEIMRFSEKLSGEVADNIASTFETMAPVIENLFKFLNDHSDVFVPLVAGLLGLRVGIGIFNLLRMAAMPFISAFAGTVGLLGKTRGLLKGTSKATKTGGRSWKFWGRSAKDAGDKAAGAGKKASKAGGKFSKAFKTAGRGVKAVSKGAGRLVGRFVPVVGPLLLLAEGATLLYNNFEPFKNLVDTTKDKVVDFGKTAGTKISEGWDRAKESFGNFGDSVKHGMDNAKSTWERIPDKASGIMQRAGDRMKKKFDPVMDHFKRKHEEWSKAETKTAGGRLPRLVDIKALAEQVTDAFSNMGETVSNAWDGVSKWWGFSWDIIKATVSKKWDSIKESASTTWDSAKEKASIAWDAVQGLWSSAWTNIQDSVVSIWDSLKTKASETWDSLKEKASTVWDNVSTGWSSTWGNVSSTLGTAWGGIKEKASNTWTNAGDTVRTAWDGVSEGWSSLWSGVSDSLSGTWSGIKSNASTAFDGAKNAVSNAWDSVKGNTDSAWNAVKDAVTSAASNASDAVTNMGSVIVDGVSSAWSSVVEATTSALSSFVEVVTSGFNQAVSLASSLPGRFQGALGNLGGLLVGSGRALVQGFVSGIRSMIGAVTSAASAVVSAARSFFPFSPAKRGPFSGKGYTTYSGKALVKDFAGGITSEVRRVERAASGAAKAASKPFQDLAHDQILQPVLESNAEKIAETRKKEREAEEEHQKRLKEIHKNGKDVHTKVAEENKKYAEKLAEIRKGLDESLEAPDYSEIEQSFSNIYVAGAKELLRRRLLEYVKSQELAKAARSGALEAVKQARSVIGNHPLLAKVEMNVNSEHFEWAFNNAIEEAGLHEVPVNFVISNLDQLKSDLGMGDGVISRAIDQAAQWNWNNTDAKRYRDEGKTEIHYHVEDMQEAIRRENLRVRKNLMKTY
ncbi:hypothetical protein LA324_05445 [Corynebacterium coyleae]|uniref:phage tail protein n=1 Tax=Corynebacterium coyleae TaxID=53374 RepID=UPI001CCACC6F|nr:hypothetical protein [Corynebacterium coyleae]UBI10054.1 hypothetical protein LA324_05445 [Corynebacterium coyleae]